MPDDGRQLPRMQITLLATRIALDMSVTPAHVMKRLSVKFLQVNESSIAKNHVHNPISRAELSGQRYTYSENEVFPC